MSLSTPEKALLRGAWDPSISELDSPELSLVKAVVECRFKDALTSETARVVFCPSKQVGENGALVDVFNIEPLDDGSTYKSNITRLSLAVACLHAFVQANWTGPALDIDPIDLLVTTESSSSSDPTSSKKCGEWTSELLQSRATAELALGGEPAYHLARVSSFLRLAQLLISGIKTESLPSVAWWRLRITNVHLRVLDEPAVPSEDFRSLLAKLGEDLSGSGSEADTELAGRLALEIGLLEHTLGRDKDAGEDFVRAARATGLKYELTGALGKRTRFQERELSQLVLLAESSLPVEEDAGADAQVSSSTDNEDAGADSDNESVTTAIDTRSIAASDTASLTSTAVAPSNIPTTLALNDDTLLERTAFTSSTPGNGALSHLSPGDQPPLHPLDQCVLLALCLNVRNTQPSHGLTAAQMAPYVDRVLTHPRAWTVHTTALLLRARLEANRTRTVERAVLQMQTLVDQANLNEEDAATPAERLAHFHGIALPPRWSLERELAMKLMSLGVVKSALEIFERLEMWADAVQCYAALEQPERGISIVRDLLEGKKEEAEAVVDKAKVGVSKGAAQRDAAREAKLWCLLGDLDPPDAAAHYSRAWEISGHTSGRAMRALGGLHFARGEWDDAVTCLERAVRINPLLLRAWFLLGCACMRKEDWEHARDAFARCVAIDEEDGESWNNLASMYLRMGSRRNAGEDSEERELMAAIPFEHKQLAFRALKHGLRHAYDNWRMWANFSVVAVDVGELAEATRALGRVVDATEGRLGVDEDILDRLVDAVTRGSQEDENKQDSENPYTSADPNSPQALSKSLFTLFERSLLPRLSTPRIFRAYARLLTWARQWKEALQAHMDCYRAGKAAGMSKGDVPDKADWEEAVREVEEVVEVLREYSGKIEDENGGNNKWRSQARGLVRSFMGRMRETMEGEPGWERLEELVEELKAED